MAERPEDLNLPITVIQRIIKESLPDGVIVSKEARQTICRASSVFVLYLTSCAVTHANKAKRKTLSVNDILSAIEDMEFQSFIEPLNEILKYRKESLSNQSSKKSSKKPDASNKEDGAEEEDDEIEVDAEEELNENEDEQKEDDEEEENNENSNERRTKKRKTGNEQIEEAEEEDEANNSESENSSESENE